jgi:hypothetical protein
VKKLLNLLLFIQLAGCGNFAFVERHTHSNGPAALAVATAGQAQGSRSLNPVPPTIETPLQYQDTGSLPLISGSGTPGARVLIAQSKDGNKVLVDTIVSLQGHWHAISALALTVGPFSMAGYQTLNGQSSTWGITRTFNVVGVVPPPVIGTPLQGSESSSRPVISGTGIPGARVWVSQTRLPDNVLVATYADAYGRWSQRSEMTLVPGTPFSMAGGQSIDNKGSKWGETRTFEIANTPSAPVITYPLQDSESGRYPRISGLATPGARVRVVQVGFADRILVNTVADDRGRWEQVSLMELPVDRFGVDALQIVDGKSSGYSSHRYFYPKNLSEGALTAQRLNARFADTRSACPNNEAAYYCNGVLLRPTDASPDFRAWDSSPRSVVLNGVSFSYLRADTRLSRLVRNQGVIMKELDASSDYLLRVRCSFPYDGATDGRSDRCTEHSTGGAISQTCEAQGINTVAKWRDYFYALPSKSFGCSFIPDQSRFDLSIKARAALDEVDANAQPNELIVAAWPQGLAEELPLEALFYTASSASALSGAKFMQRDYRRETGQTLPIVRLDLKAAQPFSYAQEDQDKPAPVFEMPDAPGGVLNSDALRDDPTVQVFYSALGVGDTVMVKLSGVTVRNTPIQTVSTVGVLNFKLSRAWLTENLNRNVNLTYTYKVGGTGTTVPSVPLSIRVTGTMSEGEHVAAELNAQYSNTSDACPGNKAALDCNGVLIRTVSGTPNYHAWNPSAGAVALGAVSFSYMRQGLGINRVAFGKTQGLILEPAGRFTRNNGYPLTVLCAYAYDANSVSRSLNGCGANHDFPADSKTCATLNLHTLTAWRTHFQAYPASSYLRYHHQCSFGIDQASFALSLAARENPSAELLAYSHNEVLIQTWPQNTNTVPIKAFFYWYTETPGAGLQGAKFMQQDFYTMTGRRVPVIRVMPNTSADNVFSFHTSEQSSFWW